VLTDFLAEELRRRGHEVQLAGPPADADLQWADVAREVAQAVGDGSVDEGVLCCWTGTSVSIAANKVPGVRASLCGDAETARGARAWNDANVLCLSLRTTTETLADEMLDAWLSPIELDPQERENVDRLRAMAASRRGDREEGLP